MSVWNLSWQFTSTIYLRNLARLQIWNQQNAYLATANAAKALVSVLAPKPIAIVSAAYALTVTAKTNLSLHGFALPPLTFRAPKARLWAPQAFF
jgi:hypothetical protein